MKPGRPRKNRNRAPHGTDAGYYWHHRLGEPPCDPCREAHNEKNRADRKKRQRQKKVLDWMLSGAQGVRRGQKPVTHQEYIEILREIKKELDEA